MNCQEFQRQLEQAVEHRCSPTAEVQQHGDECSQAACATAWSEFLLLDEAIAHWQSRPIGREAQTSQSDSRAPKALRRRRIITGQLAAVTLCLLAVQLNFSKQTATSNAPVDAIVSEIHLGNSDTNTFLASHVPDMEFVTPVTVEASHLASPGFIVNWIAGTPLQVSGSMALMLLGDRAHSDEPMLNQAPWFSSWSEQLIPSAEDIEILRSLLLNHAEQSTQHGRGGPATAQVIPIV